MGLFHKHSFALVAKTYSQPQVSTGTVWGDSSYNLSPSVERLIHGCTTFVWKCSDPNCGAVKTIVALGKERGAPP
jgi:hypothetical protein